MRDSKSLMFCFQMLAAAMRQTKVRLTAHDLRLKTSIGTVSVNRVRGLWNSSCSATNHSSKVNIMAENLLTTSNPVFQAYLYYCCILGLKMLAMSFLTARQRIRKGVSVLKFFTKIPVYLVPVHKNTSNSCTRHNDTFLIFC